MTEQEVISRLRSAIELSGSERLFAEQHRVSAQYVNDVKNGRRRPGQRILDALGIERVVTYRERLKL